MGRRTFFADRTGAAAAEMALVAPLLIALLFGSVETGNYFMTEHAVAKSVRDGARYASRLPLAANYTCPSSVNIPGPIRNVTKTGSFDGTATGRFPAKFWDKTKCNPKDLSDTEPVNVTVRCVPKASYSGVWAGLGTDIPVVTVSADVSYTPLFGFSAGGLCMHASSEAPVSGL
jgi:hypothetical protein